MSGPTIYNKTSRKAFIIKASVAVAGISLFGFSLRKWFVKPEAKVIPGKILGASHTIGHKLREVMHLQPELTAHFDYVIVGGGVSGLTAARKLTQKGISSIALFELENETGGNSSSGKNDVSAYPWGAHYMPLPNNNQPELIQFLAETGVITGYDNTGTPIYNEDYLCFDPQERLFINGYWQDGLVPNFGLPETDKKEIQLFFKLMNNYKTAVGNDGKQAFAIPVAMSSNDDTYKALDGITMQAFMADKGFKSEYLHWYVNYCCRDDFGTTINETSAWAGIHYFASRIGKAANAESHIDLVWPEGNAWLVHQLRKASAAKTFTDSLVYSVKTDAEKVIIDYYDVKAHTVKRVTANKVVMATPQFINQRLLAGNSLRNKELYDQFTYAPWMVANITVNNLHQNNGAALSWDNVNYNSNSLGYVNANHQDTNVYANKKVITYYLPLSHVQPKQAREEAIEKTHADWVKQIIKDLSTEHKEIENEIENIDIWLWGHGMIRPLPGFISSEYRKQAALPIDNKIFFAHSDLSGISIFEEAFYHGTRAVNEMLNEV